MNSRPNKFDAELLQARWELARWHRTGRTGWRAILALEHGFSGIALQQIAGLNLLAARDLGTLPDRAFAEIGL
jgi:hypothetical protein